MNQPPEHYILVTEERLLAFATECFRRAGCEDDHAALIARLLVNNDLRGVRSHGTQSAAGYCTGLVEGGYNPRPDVRVVHQTETVVVVDRYVRGIRDGHDPVPGTDRVLLPGAIEAERMERYRVEGIPYGEPEQDAARVLHERFEVPLPWEEL